MRLNSSLIKLALLALLPATLSATPVGTAFTFQGRVPNSAPANGTVPMNFSLWTAASGGNNAGNPSSLSRNVTVAGRVFSVELDFGAAAFTGDERWLQIERNGVVDPQRIRVAPTPNAIYASTAGGVRDGAITSGNVADNAITGAKIASGQVVKSISVNGSGNLRDVVNLAAGNNITLTPSGDTVTIASLGGGGSGPWQTLNNNAYYNGGNVGIGTASPTFPLHVNSSATASSVLEALLQPSLVSGGFNQIYLGRTPTGNGCSTFTYTYDGANPALSRLSLGLYNSSFSLNVLGNGNVGIGVANPLAALHVIGDWDGNRTALQLGGRKPTIRFLGDAVSGNQNWILHLGSEGPGNLQFMRRDGFIDERVLTLGANNNVGVGTPNPTEKLHVAGRFLRVDGLGGEAAYIGGDGLGNDVQVGSLNSSVTHIHMYNASSQTHMHTHVGVLTIHGGADIAEPFPMKEESIEKGSVVIIDDEHPGRLKRSTQAYDSRVAGIISGANGINPGIALKQEGALDQGENVALSGRVYVQADASFGAIKPGDLLTTSDTPGHAMKVADSTRAQGAILGKAMTALADGKGMVLVLVTLQ